MFNFFVSKYQLLFYYFVHHRPTLVLIFGTLSTSFCLTFWYFIDQSWFYSLLLHRPVLVLLFGGGCECKFLSSTLSSLVRQYATHPLWVITHLQRILPDLFRFTRLYTYSLYTKTGYFFPVGKYVISEKSNYS